VFFDNTPQTIFVRPIRRPLIHHLGYAVGHGAIDNMRVSGYPSNVGRAPEDIVFFHIEDPLVGKRDTSEITTCRMHDPLGFTRSTAGKKKKKDALTVHLPRPAPERCFRHKLIPPMVPS